MVWYSLLGLPMTLFSLCLHTLFPPPVSMSSPPHEDVRHTGLGATLMTPLTLITALKAPSPTTVTI